MKILQITITVNNKEIHTEPVNIETDNPESVRSDYRKTFCERFNDSIFEGDSVEVLMVYC